MVMCYAPTCKHYSERNTCKFFRFPTEQQERKRWIKLLRREDREAGKHSRVCSCHFVDGISANGPTIFDYNMDKVFRPSPKKSKKRKITVAVPECEAGPSGMQAISRNSNEKREHVEETQESTGEISHDIDTLPGRSELGTVTVPKFAAMVEAENFFLKEQICNLTKEVEKLLVQFSFKHIENNSHLLSVYTGLPAKEIFLGLYSLFENMELSYFRGWQVVNMSKIDQLLLTLMKLKLNLLNDDLASRFNVSRETVSNIFKTWLFALHEILFKQLMKDIPSRNKNRLCMPSAFSSFTNCRVIIDCTEVYTIRPKHMGKQRSTYSAYKHRNTLKGLIGVAPNGVVTFVSDLYPGGTSDKKITKHCGILHKLEKGDLVLADKGFLITDILPEGGALNVPPFLTTNQFTPEQVVRTRTIAKARIHVERAIKKIKSYTILSSIPATMIPHSSIIFQVCAALTNLHFPLIKEVEHLFDY